MWIWQLLVQIRQMLLEDQVGSSAVSVPAAFIKSRSFPTSCWLFHCDWRASASLALHFVSASVGAQACLHLLRWCSALASTCCDVV